MTIMTICMVMVVTDNTWNMVMRHTDLWLQENHWDIKVDHAVWKFLGWLDRNHKEMLGILIVITVLHLIFSFMLIVGTLLYRKNLFLPWMISHMISIILMVIIFTCWTFFSFFIDLLLAIVFPVVAGLLLGLWIVMWREVQHFFTSLMDSDMQLLVSITMQAQYQPVEE